VTYCISEFSLSKKKRLFSFEICTCKISDHTMVSWILSLICLVHPLSSTIPTVACFHTRSCYHNHNNNCLLAPPHLETFCADGFCTISVKIGPPFVSQGTYPSAKIRYGRTLSLRDSYALPSEHQKSTARLNRRNGVGES